MSLVSVAEEELVASQIIWKMTCSTADGKYMIYEGEWKNIVPKLWRRIEDNSRRLVALQMGST